MSQPFLSRFAEYKEEDPMPPIHCDPITQTSEVFWDGRWVSALEHNLLRGGNGTKTAVYSETTDYR
jgi:hypothetical protein